MRNAVWSNTRKTFQKISAEVGVPDENVHKVFFLQRFDHVFRLSALDSKMTTSEQIEAQFDGFGVPAIFRGLLVAWLKYSEKTAIREGSGSNCKSDESTERVIEK
jgi:hypothetical protein